VVCTLYRSYFKGIICDIGMAFWLDSRRSMKCFGVHTKTIKQCLLRTSHVHVMRGDESHIIYRVMTMNVDGHPSRGRPRKRWIDCVKDDMKIKGVSMEMTSDRREWNKKTRCADPT
jgi:hypothetical protein